MSGANLALALVLSFFGGLVVGLYVVAACLSYAVASLERMTEPPGGGTKQ